MLIKPSRRSRRAAAGTATAAILLGLGALLPGDLVPGAAGGGAEAPSYVSLGDSLAAGSQPDGDGDDGPTRQGYADVIGRRLGKVYPGLRTVRLSCGGANTSTLLTGRAGCQPPGDPPQLVQQSAISRAIRTSRSSRWTSATTMWRAASASTLRRSTRPACRPAAPASPATCR